MAERKTIWKMTCMLSGIFGMGIFLSFLLKAGYGTDTSAFMNSSLSARTGLSLGTVMVTTNALFLIPQLIWGRKLIGPGTIANMTLIGYTSDLCTMLENRYIPAEVFQNQPYRAAVFAAALALFLISAAVYMNAEAGLAPFDSIPVMVSSRTGLPFFLVRMFWDFAVTAVGVAAGGHLTAGTIILAFTVGPSVGWIGRMMRRRAEALS